MAIQTKDFLQTIESEKNLHKLILENDTIIIDSFTKLKELNNKFEIDKNLREKYNGKLFFIIFQLTSTGKMRGGSSSQFDGDCIFFVDKKEDYRESFVYTDKNRYQNKPLHDLGFNIYSGKITKTVEENELSEIVI